MSVPPGNEAKDSSLMVLLLGCEAVKCLTASLRTVDKFGSAIGIVTLDSRLRECWFWRWPHMSNARNTSTLDSA